MKNMIPSIIDKFRHSDYYRSEITKETHGDKLADIVFLFFYDGVQQVDRGLTFCRAIWNNESCQFPLNPFTPDESINDIDIIWDKDYSYLADFIPDNELPKGFYLDTADKVYHKSKQLFESMKSAVELYDNNRKYNKLVDKILFLESELEDLNNNKLNEGSAPLECQELDSLISSIVVFLHNILIVVKDKSREENNVIYLVRDYLNEVKEKLPFYDYERKKVK